MKKQFIPFLILLGIFITIIGCEKNQSLSPSPNNEIEMISRLEIMIEEIDDGTYQHPEWNPPSTGITLSKEGYLVIESQEVLDAFVVSLNNATIEDLDNWEKSMDFMSLRRSGKWQEENKASEFEKYTYPFDDLLMSTIVNIDGYVMKLGELHRVSNEGIYMLQDKEWVFHPVDREWEENPNVGAIELRQNCLDDYDDCNKFWTTPIKHRSTGVLWTTSNWFGYSTKVRGRTSHDIKQNCLGGYNYCDYPADKLILAIGAYTTSNNYYSSYSSATNAENLTDYIYVAYSTCFDSAASIHRVYDEGSQYTCNVTISN